MFGPRGPEEATYPKMTFPTMGIIYHALDTSNGMAYVGQTIQTLEERLKGHRKPTRIWNDVPEWIQHDGEWKGWQKI